MTPAHTPDEILCDSWDGGSVVFVRHVHTYLHDNGRLRVIDVGFREENLPQAAGRALEKRAQGLCRHRVQLILGKIQGLFSCFWRSTGGKATTGR